MPLWRTLIVDASPLKPNLFATLKTLMTDLTDNPYPATWQAPLRHSRYLRQLLEAHPEIADWLKKYASAPFNLELMREFLETPAPATEDELKQALRRLRQRVMATLIVRDLAAMHRLPKSSRP